MQKIKALYLSPVPDFKGGAERSLFDLLVNPDIDPLLVVPEDGELADRARTLNIPVEIVDFGSVHRVRRPFKIWHGVQVLSDAWRASRRLKAILATTGVDIVHTNGLKAHSIASLTKIGASPRIVMHFRDIAYTAQEKLVWWAQSRIASRVVYVSRACYPGAQLPRNGRVIFNGIDPRAPIALNPANPLRVGFIGRIHPHKGLHTLLDWIQRAKLDNVEVHLFVRGKFTTEAPEYEAQIRAQVNELQLQDNIHFEGFFAEPEAVYKNLDAICAPAQAAEPLARTILEPMSMGIPVIATATGGTTEMVVNNVTGFIVDGPENFKQAILAVQSNNAALSSMMAAGRDHIMRHFSKNRLHKSIYSLYSELLNEKQK
ncbi:glycosyltransferase family 4 protein [Rhizobium sp. Rhizsp82]|uniref:glycosyltransferase family 4 protein n=1 Tax=Rhizobium sp. Rhizsp82 TaxID=3243057 RepID=UPI0039B4EFD6